MPDPYEHHPLLCEEFSDEEAHLRSTYHRQISRGVKNRSHSSLQGATVLMRRWPDYWSSTLLYWWTILGMITITVFVIYNTILTLALVPQPKPFVQRTLVKSHYNNKSNLSYLPEVFIHLFPKYDGDADVDKYLLSIETLATKQADYNYNIVIVQDPKLDQGIKNEKLLKKIAYSSLRDTKETNKKIKSQLKNVYIKYDKKCNIMDSSQLKSKWRHLPQKFVEFLVRALSIWDNGGIVLDPVILTNEFPNSAYIDKIEVLMKQYRTSPKIYRTSPKINNTWPSKSVTNNKYHKHKRPNNIRDVINLLLDEDNNTNIENNLTEAEDKNVDILVRKSRFLIEEKTNGLKSISDNKSKAKNRSTAYPSNNVKFAEPKNSYSGNNDTPEFFRNFDQINDKNEEPTLLPRFLEYIFPKSGTTFPPKDTNLQVTSKHTSIKHNEINSNRASNVFHNYTLTIDLQGYLIATGTPCHAFIGSIFSDLMHYDKEESLTEFIISEVSKFCKGFLWTCPGIEVLLV